jgi:hypothetical protein
LGFATIGNVAFVALEERHARLDAPYAAGVVDIGACGLSMEERHARLDAPYAAGVVDIGACGLSSNRSRRAE